MAETKIDAGRLAALEKVVEAARSICGSLETWDQQFAIESCGSKVRWRGCAGPKTCALVDALAALDETEKNR